ncbi:MAG TPA: hypothetical protein VGB64_12895 [Actinomycetota bacterium]
MRRACLVWVVAAAAVAAWASPAAAEGRPPRLDRFVARYNPTSTTTFYIAVAGDPDGGKLSYRWALEAECGYLTDPETTGPSQGFQHGPPARRPDGCTNEQDGRARITLRITDPEGCGIVYSQGARDETEHVAPPVQSMPCPPAGEPQAAPPPAAASKPLPVAAILLVAAALLGLFALARVRRRMPRPARANTEWDASLARPDVLDASPAPRTLRDREPTFEPPAPTDPAPLEPEPAPAPLTRDDPDLLIRSSSGDVLPTIRASESLIEDVPSFMEEDEFDIDVPPLFAEDEPEAAPLVSGPVSVPVSGPVSGAVSGTGRLPAPCREGAVRKLDNDFVAHDTVLAGAVRARALRNEATVEIPADDPAEILRLATGMSDDAPLEVEVEIPLRLVTVVSTRREVCRDGTWVPEVESATHDGAPRIERLRAIVTGPDELERFARDILAKRLRTLTGARRRLESALAAMRGRT